MGRRRNSSAINKLFTWVRRQSMKVKAFLAVTCLLSALVALKLLIKDYDHFFVASEAAHFLGIIVLIYKLSSQKTCSGLSLKSQELTAIFLGVRVFCSFFIEGDIHTVLDFVTLVSTLWVIYMIRFKLKSTYGAELDNMPIYYVAVPCAILAVLIYPYTSHATIYRILWAFCVYLEAISVLPQLRMIQNAKMIEAFTAHYVFALGVARFFGFAHWIILMWAFQMPIILVADWVICNFFYLSKNERILGKVSDTAGLNLLLVRSGYLWRLAVFLAEVVQTFILADFCYYYVKSLVGGQVLASLPV